MPYMGSKRKLANKIVDKILLDNPNTKYAYDLFGGGGAISFELLQRAQIQKVHYNELNSGVVALLQDIRNNGVTDKYFQWINRETFMKHKKDDDWFGGLCKVVWSFGNNQNDYLFGKKIEALKKEAHDYLIDNGYLEDRTKRIPLIKEFKQKALLDGRFELERLERLQQLERLQRLQQLERLQQLQQLELSNLSYCDVIIDTPIDETIIYLDPPYLNTGKYAEELVHSELYEYIKNSKYKIYLSSYESDLTCVLEMEHRSTLSSVVNIKTIEKLFTNNML